MSTDHYSGLEETLSISSSITLVQEDNLSYRGIPIVELFEKANFEEVVYLLWYGRLPGVEELKNFIYHIQDNMSFLQNIQDRLHSMPRGVHPQNALCYLVSTLALYDPEIDKFSDRTLKSIALRIFSKMPILISSFERHRKAKDVCEPKPELTFVGNCLYLLRGQVAEKYEIDALEKCLILYADHSLNASTLAVRITTGTVADMYSAIISGINALKGYLHRGANQEAMEMIMNIDSPKHVPEWIEAHIAKGNKVMGFGHRVYKKGDPRAKLLKDICEQVCNARNCQHYYEVGSAIEEYMKQKFNITPNIDFYTGMIFYALGIPIDLFTSIFSIGRCAGWIAHILEQYSDNRLVYPKQNYTGKTGITYTPIEAR